MVDDHYGGELSSGQWQESKKRWWTRSKAAQNSTDPFILCSPLVEQFTRVVGHTLTVRLFVDALTAAGELVSSPLFLLLLNQIFSVVVAIVRLHLLLSLLLPFNRRFNWPILSQTETEKLSCFSVCVSTKRHFIDRGKPTDESCCWFSFCCCLQG